MLPPLSAHPNRWVVGVSQGVAIAGILWGLEAGAAALTAASVSGAALVGPLVPTLCRWGLGYLALGAGFGAALGPFAGLGWVGVWAVADPGVAGPWLPLGALALSWGLGAGFGRWGKAPWALGALVLAVGLGAIRWPAPIPASPGTGPDVVVVVIDTLRRDHVGSYGYGRDTTPNLDALALRGLRFSEARATSSWTLPSHASLFTGRLPHEHGATEETGELPPGTPTLAGTLKGRGYRTLGLSANGWVSAGTGLDQGFDELRFKGDDGISSQLLLPLAVARPIDQGGQSILDDAVQAMNETEGPLFLFVNWLEAHEPYGTLPEPSLSQFSAVPLDPTLGRQWLADMPRSWCQCERSAGELDCREGRYRASPSRAAAVVDRYDAGVRYDDALLGQLLSALAKRGRPTVIAVTSDHGEHLGEDGLLGHMVWLDEALLEIPLVLAAPGLAPGVSDRPTSLADLPGLLTALVDGEPLPEPQPVVVSESHPHNERNLALWEGLYDCDFGPARERRRVIWSPQRRLVWGGERPGDLGEAEAAAWDAPFGAGGGDWEVGEALRGLGYVR